MKENSVYNGNAFKLLKEIKDESIDLICVDPPYGIKYKDWDDFDFNSFTSQWVDECYRVLKPMSSTLVAAIKTRRQFIGFEQDKKYYDIAIERLKNG